MRFPLDQDALEPPLEKMPDPMMTRVEPHRIALIQPLHPTRETDLGCLDQQVIVVRHQNPRVKDPAPKRYYLFENLQESPPIPVIAIDDTPLIAARGDVVDRSRKVDSELTGQTSAE